MTDGSLPCWDDFAGRDGCAYTLLTDGEQYSLTLAQAEERGGAARTGGSFRLEFRGPREPLLPQGIYRVRADNLDAEIFLVPVGRDEQGSLYEAIFN